MRLLEHEAKQLLSEAGLLIPRELLTASPEKAASFAQSLGGPVVVKAQVPAGGRMKAGGVLFAASAVEAEKAARTILGLTIKGYAVELVSVQEQIKEAGALYLAVTIDANSRQALILGSLNGGVEIESGSAIQRQTISLREDLPVFWAREFAAELLTNAPWAQGALHGSTLQALTDVVLQLARLFRQNDALLLEVNPLICTGSLERLFVAADAHCEIDDDALFRQRELARRLGLAGRGECPRKPLEQKAADIDGADHRGVAGRVVEFDGDLALLIGGGGASLTAFDAILDAGGKPANYCEIGGNPSVWKTAELTKLLLSKRGVNRLAVIMNVVNNTRVDLMARGVIKGIIESGREPAEVIAAFRIPGSWEDEGAKILSRYGVRAYGREVSIHEVAARVVREKKE